MTALIVIAVIVVVIALILSLSATVTVVYDNKWRTTISVLWINKDVELSKILSFILFPQESAKKVIVARKFVNVASKVGGVIEKLKAKRKVKFLNLFSDAQSKSDLVATFLAVLELAKTKKIILNGSMQDMEVSISEEGESVEN